MKSLTTHIGITAKEGIADSAARTQTSCYGLFLTVWQVYRDSRSGANSANEVKARNPTVNDAPQATQRDIPTPKDQTRAGASAPKR